MLPMVKYGYRLLTKLDKYKKVGQELIGYLAPTHCLMQDKIKLEIFTVLVVEKMIRSVLYSVMEDLEISQEVLLEFGIEQDLTEHTV